MRIVPYPNFQNASNLRWPPDLRDPRESGYPYSDVEVDLRKCEFVSPSAALWCVIYPLLVRNIGIECRVLLPENSGLCTYLKSLGLFQVLQQSGVDLDDKDAPARDNPQVVLPLTRFENQSQADSLANSALAAVRQSGIGSSNLYPLVSETIAELAANAAQHSKSMIGAFCLIQVHDNGVGQRFVCVVADGRIGIRESLARIPDLEHRIPYDWIAIEMAVREFVSGTGEATRGIGLFGVAEDMRSAGRSLTIHSGIGSLSISEDMQSNSRRTRLFPGTLVCASIPA